MNAHLRLVTWNCKGMGRRNVLSLLDQSRPDILVIPEYANADALCDPPEGYSLVSVQWERLGPSGKTERWRHLAVLAADGWTLHQPDDLAPIVGGIILPVEIAGPTQVRLMAVAGVLKPTPIVNPIVEAVEAWADWVQGPLVVAGDFGTSGIAAKRGKPPGLNHFAVLEALAALGLSSAYHAHFGVAQGEERHATYWQFGHEDKRIHIDHVFTSSDLTVTDLHVGTWDAFHKLSDHAPIIVDLTSAAATNQEAL